MSEGLLHADGVSSAVTQLGGSDKQGGEMVMYNKGRLTGTQQKYHILTMVGANIAQNPSCASDKT